MKHPNKHITMDAFLSAIDFKFRKWSALQTPNATLLKDAVGRSAVSPKHQFHQFRPLGRSIAPFISYSHGKWPWTSMIYLLNTLIFLSEISRGYW
jgi:hypothetical protein